MDTLSIPCAADKGVFPRATGADDKDEPAREFHGHQTAVTKDQNSGSSYDNRRRNRAAVSKNVLSAAYMVLTRLCRISRVSKKRPEGRFLGY